MKIPRSLALLLSLAQALASSPTHANDHSSFPVESILEAIAASPFDEPIHLESEEKAGEVRGRVHAILDVPLAELRKAVASPRGWCEILFLHYNVKTCVRQSVAGEAGMTVFIGRKYYQDPEVVKQIRLRFYEDDRREDRLSIQLQTDHGPLGTREFRIEVRAVPLDGHRSLLRFSYSLGYGRMARFAMRVYFATAGRERIGFTVERHDPEGRPVHVRGMRGMIERNTMHFFHALTAYLRMPGQGRQEARHALWFEQAERYPRQLRELDKDAYLEQKRRERRNQDVLQADIEDQGASAAPFLPAEGGFPSRLKA
jgi:hypothetical protein